MTAIGLVPDDVTLVTGDAERGQAMHDLAVRLFPICRSITGSGVRETLRILQESLPIQIQEVPLSQPIVLLMLASDC